MDTVASTVEIVLEEVVAQVPANPPLRPALGRSLLRHVGTWQGDDFEECLRSVVKSRGQVEFRNE